MPQISLKLLRRLGWGVVAGTVIVLAAEATAILVGRNFHTVIPGRVYRCAQPSPAEIRQYVARHGIRTIVNLRGCCAGMDWYHDQCQATATCNVIQEDLTFSAGRLPAAGEVRRLVEVLDRATFPILVHCRRGVDRTGLTSAVAKILLENASLPTARNELSLCHGHVSLGRTENMLRFFSLYESWLREEGREHNANSFRTFVKSGYTAGPAKVHWESIHVPAMRASQQAAFNICVKNESAETWHFRPGTGSGVHLRFTVTDPVGTIRQNGVAGLFRKSVEPGQSVELQIAVNGLAPGPYTLTANLHESPDVSFAQLGCEPLVQEFVVQ